MSILVTRALTVLACLALLAGAGCMTPAPAGYNDDGRPDQESPTGGPNEGNTSQPADSASRGFRGVGCDGAFLSFMVPVERAQEFLPSSITATGGPDDSLAWVQLRHSQCDRLVVDNATDFPNYREVQLWIHIEAPPENRPSDGWYSYYAIKSWQRGVPVEVFEGFGISVADGDYYQTTDTVVPDVWAVTTGNFEPADHQEAWSFQALSDDLPVADTQHYRVFFGDEPIGYYDLLVEGLHSNQDYGGVLVAEADSTVSYLSGTDRIGVDLSGIYVETILGAELYAS